MASTLRNVLSQFTEAADSHVITPLGEGNINDTFLAKADSGGIVLQCINPAVFPEPERVVRNFIILSKHLQARRDKNQQWQDVVAIPTISGASFFRDDQRRIWRAQSYLEKTITHTTIVSADLAEQVGWALGYFHSLVSDLPTTTFTEALPGLHDLPRYLHSFSEVLTNHGRPITSSLKICLEGVEKYHEMGNVLGKLREGGKLTTQVIHGDPKADNVLFRRDSGRAISLIDLDTVGVGPLHYDIGDCLRSCCNKGGEASGDAGVIGFDLALARSLLRGYYSSAAKVASAEDRRYIFEAVFTISFELGVRFLTDYLAGNHYFKVKYEEENLQKAFNQFLLVEDICRKEDLIRELGLKP